MSYMRQVVFAAVAALLVALPINAAEFDPNYIISDSELVNHSAMDADDIQAFLDKQPGTLSNYIAIDKEGAFKTASQTFFEVAQRWLINPKYLLVLVQKEQSLLTDTDPKQGQYDRAAGYGCPDSGGCDDRWKGFYRQVNSAAAQTRYYQDNIDEFNYRPGKTSIIDGQEVTPKNAATAGLYNYTPHIHGNQLLWNLWNKYFGKKWPDGTLMRALGDDTVYLIEDGAKREITSKAVLASRFNTRNIVDVDTSDVNSYDDGPPIQYLNFSILKDSRGDVYMIDGDTLRKFSSPTLLATIGIPADEVISVSRGELDDYDQGPEITESTLTPTGALLQDTKTNQIYYAQSGRKREILSKEIMAANFPGVPIKKASFADLDQYRTGEPMTMPEGSLLKVKNSPTVYVIADGKRLPIFSGEIFQRMNYKWTNVQVVTTATLEAHQLGQTITGDW